MTRERGRPLGTVTSPHRILRKSLQDSAKLASRTRKLLEGRLTFIEKRLATLEPDQDVDGLVDQLLKIMAALDRTVEQTGRLLTLKHAPADAAEPASAVDVLSELTKGKKK